MAKIHTHYDNLKVARGAPGEVIRAAYKALSQKYHPDKNPGDEKAARIMAIVNTAYNTLSDPVRRKEHDEWIASEEWEVEWLESSGAEEGEHGAGRGRPDSWEPRATGERRPRARLMRDPRWWLGLSGCLVLGAAAALFVGQQPRARLPEMLSWAGKPDAIAPVPAAPNAKTAPTSDRPDELGSDASTEGWARRFGGDGPAPPPEIKALAVTQLVVPARAPDCGTDLQTLAAPSGDAWPAESGYLPGYPVGNSGSEMQMIIDNGENPSPIFVKLYDLDRRSNVRHVYVQANGNFIIDKLAAGKYEVRYQNIVVGDGKTECVNGRRAPLRQAAAGG
ncbi:DnaJ domain-containing protein [Massilia sp. G4R7]|uniref:DnaJ domain-containing protein n=1 Tax=Massilia phyllostachyos TaxID=2898585 RepID=A0ABS8Q535_9BURK|nr:J domain-containing protein [Massilia phyllostachyos]MCD2516857.1 DnaJ domain-containing protein [Massilia phyllostachyos]